MAVRCSKLWLTIKVDIFVCADKPGAVCVPDDLGVGGALHLGGLPAALHPPPLPDLLPAPVPPRPRLLRGLHPPHLLHAGHLLRPGHNLAQSTEYNLWVLITESMTNRLILILISNSQPSNSNSAATTVTTNWTSTT